MPISDETSCRLHSTQSHALIKRSLRGISPSHLENYVRPHPWVGQVRGCAADRRLQLFQRCAFAPDLHEALGEWVMVSGMRLNYVDYLAWTCRMAKVAYMSMLRYSIGNVTRSRKCNSCVKRLPNIFIGLASFAQDPHDMGSTIPIQPA